jgi:ABC-type molybdenum transport system ATPase subunit/photorepair protein PhrA
MFAAARGGGGPRDIHLENFSVSNGGRELVVDAHVSLAVGRRYGLIGRNGTGAQMVCGWHVIARNQAWLHT